MAPRQIERVFKHIGKDIQKAAERAVNRAAREGVYIAKQDSRGTWNRKRRQKEGYSYSRLNPNPPPQPLGVINKETGVFLAAWKFTPAQLFPGGGGEVVSFILNESDRAEDLTAYGKPWLRRPIAERLVARLTPVFQFEVEKLTAQLRVR